MTEEQIEQQDIDEPSVRQFVERALNYAGFAVTAVGDGNAALEALSRQRYDLLLTDIVMPDLDGIALALKAADDAPAVRPEAVARGKALLESGTLGNDPMALADRLIDALLDDPSKG